MLTNSQQQQLKKLHQQNIITNEEWQERIDSKTNNQYVLEKIFTTEDDKWFTARCKTCGDELTKSVHYLRKSALYKKHTCVTCTKQKRLDEQNRIKEEKIKQREEQQIFKCFLKKYYKQPKKVVLKTIKKLTTTCKYCNQEFNYFGTSRRSVCDVCKVKQSKRSKRLLMIYTRPHDDDITLRKLFSRDKGICYLCGSKCDWNSKHIDSKGNVIADNYYPSVDHVIALHDGGTHQWSNVKLAHRICNTLKH